MSDEETKGSANGDSCAQGVPDPEKGRPNAGQLLYEAFEEALGKNAGKIIASILGGVENMNPTCVREVLKFANELRNQGGASEVAYQSLAEVLWKALQVVEAEDAEEGKELVGKLLEG
jgi:hypothetical protein